MTWEGGNSTQSNTAYFERHQWDGSATNLDNVLARKSLGLGDMALQSSDSANITGGVIKGISPLSTEDGGTGVDLSEAEGILKVANGIFTEALPGIDFITKDSTNDILNKVLSGETNKLLNFDLSIFAKGVIDPSPILEEESDYKLATQKAIKTYITDRLAGANWISPVRCASTTNLDILNDLVPGKTIDGVILKAKDRVLLKDQTLAAENGITICMENLYEGVAGHLVEGPGCDVRKAIKRIDDFNSRYGAEVLGFCFDIGHANLVGLDFYDFITSLGPRLKVLHLHDNDGMSDLHQLPFTFTKTRENNSSTNWPAFIQALKDICFDGVLSFETAPVLDSFPPEMKFTVLKFIRETGTYLASEIEK